VVSFDLYQPVVHSYRRSAAVLQALVTPLFGAENERSGSYEFLDYAIFFYLIELA
jgi:hypothetical protein